MRSCLLIPVCILLLAVLPLGARAQDTLAVGFYNNPPKIFRSEQGDPAGFWPDLIDALAEKLQLGIEYVDCEWVDCLEMLSTGEIDVMPDVALAESRRSRFEFGQYPVLFAWSNILVPVDSGIDRLRDLDGARIAVLADSIQAERLDDVLSLRGIEVSTIPTENMNTTMQAIREGEADAAITNNFFAESAVKRSEMRILDEPFGASALHFAFAPGTPATLTDSFDLAIYRYQNTADSPLERAKLFWLMDERAYIPRWLWFSLVGLGVLLMAALVIGIVLRRMVQLRTRELATTVGQLETALENQTKAESVARERRDTEALGRLVGGVAHDFNNLLTIILGRLDLLRETVDSPEAVQQIDSALDAADRGAALTQQLLAFGRKAHLRPETVNLNDLVLETATILRRTLRTQIEIETDLDPSAPHVHVDPNSMKNALLNLALNARDSIDGPGHIRVSTRAVSTIGSEFDGIYPSEDGFVIIEFTDDGEGMTPDVRHRVFEPFFTTKERGQGAGMGLAMVHGFVRQSRGAIAVESESGSGTTFRIAFPRVGNVSAMAEQAPELPVEEDANLSVLLVEDDPAVLSVLRHQLISLGCRVSPAVDGAAAFALVEDGLEFDCLISDMSMPGTLQGLDLARRVREIQPTVPVILLSGYAQEMVDPDRMDLPGTEFLRKPVHRAELAAALKRAVQS